ncbi:MAG: tetratricopeptide repeat protein [Bradymonadaceae bacterium]
MRGRICAVLLVAGLATLASSPAYGADEGEASDASADRRQSPLPFGQDPKALYERARKAYNAEKYQRAARLYVQAIQLTPDRPKLYRDLARTYFWRGDYARAVVYYDDYIRLSPDSADLKDVRSERKLAANRAGKKVWTLPSIQKDVLDALREKLSNGPAYTEGGGGAWGLYRTLLRTGYARPDLRTLQNRMYRNLTGQFRSKLDTSSGQPTPTLDLDDWQLQAARLAAARKLVLSEDRREAVDQLQLVVDTALALLNSKYRRAADLARRALDANPEASFLRWFRAAALIHAGDHGAARSALDRLKEETGSGDANRDYVRVLQALVDQRRGDHERAARRYRQLFIDR